MKWIFRVLSRRAWRLFCSRRGATNAAGITSHATAWIELTAWRLSERIDDSLGRYAGGPEQTAACDAESFGDESSGAKVLSTPSVIATDSITGVDHDRRNSVPTLTSQAVNAGITASGNSLFTQTDFQYEHGNRPEYSGAREFERDCHDGDQPGSDGAGSKSDGRRSINSPSFSQRNVSTQVTVQDGDTIAIGGIINETTRRKLSSGHSVARPDSVSGLRRLGIKSSTKKRTELIIFLTPRVIYDTNQIYGSVAGTEGEDEGICGKWSSRRTVRIAVRRLAIIDRYNFDFYLAREPKGESAPQDSSGC